MSNDKANTLVYNSKLSEATVHALDELFSSTKPEELKQSLQDLIFFVLINTDPQWYPDNFKDIISRIYFLDQFLTAATSNEKSN